MPGMCVANGPGSTMMNGGIDPWTLRHPVNTRR